MGWSSGSEVFGEIWGGLRELIAPELRLKGCVRLISALQKCDWDTEEDCIRDEWPEVEEALRVLDPKWFEEDI